MTVDARFVAARELLDRCRARVTDDDIRNYVPSDPGSWDYYRAFTAIRERGESAIEHTFDVTETIGLTRWSAIPSRDDATRFRCFRLLTAAVDVLLDDDEHPHYALVTLIADSFELGDDAPLDLLSTVCREVYAHSFGPHGKEFTFCLLGQLVLAGVDQLAPPAIDALCEELDARDMRHREAWELDSREILWTLTVYDQLHDKWLRLVDDHFPETSPIAVTLKQMLLRDGARWR